MKHRICPQDGYAMDGHETFDSPGIDWLCRNPWHPHHPGPCPKCGSKANHKSAGLGMEEALCAKCGNEWTPSVAVL